MSPAPRSAITWIGWASASIPTKTRSVRSQHKDVVEITAWGARVRTLVVETNEELMIARDTKEVLADE